MKKSILKTLDRKKIIFVSDEEAIRRLSDGRKLDSEFIKKSYGGSHQAIYENNKLIYHHIWINSTIIERKRFVMRHELFHAYHEQINHLFWKMINSKNKILRSFGFFLEEMNTVFVEYKVYNKHISFFIYLFQFNKKDLKSFLRIILYPFKEFIRCLKR